MSTQITERGGTIDISLSGRTAAKLFGAAGAIRHAWRWYEDQALLGADRGEHRRLVFRRLGAIDVVERIRLHAERRQRLLRRVAGGHQSQTDGTSRRRHRVEHAGLKAIGIVNRQPIDTGGVEALHLVPGVGNRARALKHREVLLLGAAEAWAADL